MSAGRPGSRAPRAPAADARSPQRIMDADHLQSLPCKFPKKTAEEWHGSRKFRPARNMPPAPQPPGKVNALAWKSQPPLPPNAPLQGSIAIQRASVFGRLQTIERA